MKQESDFLTEEDLYERGWTEDWVTSGVLTLIQAVPGRRFANARPVLVYALAEVEEIECFEDFRRSIEQAADERGDPNLIHELEKRFERLDQCGSRPYPCDSRDELQILFIEWWIGQMAVAPGLEARETARRRARRERESK